LYAIIKPEAQKHKEIIVVLLPDTRERYISSGIYGSK